MQFGQYSYNSPAISRGERERRDPKEVTWQRVTIPIVFLQFNSFILESAVRYL